MRANGPGGLLVCLLLVAPLSPAEGKAIRASNDPVRDEPPVDAADRAHWAFQPLPTDGGSGHANGRHPIDHWIEARLRAEGLEPGPVAAPHVLARRLAFALTGLPPGEDRLARFVEECDRSGAGAAVAMYADELMAGPEFGQHWAQWWLDLARFAETDGFEHDKERARAWQYRDWVIAALNQDDGLDDFIRQQVAGDLLPDGDKIATGFLVAGPDMPDLNNQDERRHVLLNEMTGTVGSVFLGLTVACAQCHDHAFDPLSQAEFYRLRSFFDDTLQLRRDQPMGPHTQVALKNPPPSVVFVRGDFRRPGPVVSPGVPRVLPPLVAGADDSHPRAALAGWLSSAENGVMLRVMANRLWQQMFAQALAPVPGDLGRQSPPPSHPELLDWLAGELPRLDWSLKRFLRMLVLSDSWQRATAGPELDERASVLYAAMPRRRLTGEMIRDTLLLVSGGLDRRAGGPGIRPPLPREVDATLLKKHAGEVSPAADQRRRSIYVFTRRNARLPIFDLFDRPDALTSCARREESTTAPQAMALLNSEFASERARELAGLLRASHRDDAARIVPAAFRRCLGRDCTEAEQAAATAFLDRQSQLAGGRETAVADFCLALINSNEFVFVD